MNGSTIYHVSFFEDDTNYYFGSITAIFDKFTNEEIGVTKTTLWSYGLAEDKPYMNKKCIIRKGTIHRTKTKRRAPV